MANENPYASPLSRQERRQVKSSAGDWLLFGWAAMTIVCILLAMFTGMMRSFGFSWWSQQREQIAIGFASLFGIVLSMLVAILIFSGFRMMHISRLEPKEPTP